MHTITLYRSATAWVADMSDAAQAAEILELFGTTHLPTPYGPTVDSVTVALAVSRRNQDHRVVVRHAAEVR
jgi:hypothetical protein